MIEDASVDPITAPAVPFDAAAEALDTDGPCIGEGQDSPRGRAETLRQLRHTIAAMDALQVAAGTKTKAELRAARRAFANTKRRK